MLGWLAYEPHEELWSVVLTQRVTQGESLADCRRRFAKRQRDFMRWLDRRGLVGAMTTVHIVWSKAVGGWHYHCHVFVEMERGRVTADGLWERWYELCGGDAKKEADDAVRLVSGAGGPILSLREDGGDPEFWKESRDPAARAVQYPMRDLAQGIAASRLGVDGEGIEKAAEELVTQAAGWKLFRAWGRWRKACPAAVAASKAAAPGEAATAEDEGKKKKPAAPAKGDPLGTVRNVWHAARRGEMWAREAFMKFERTVSNASDFARRFVKYCRLAWDPGGG